MAKFRSKPTTVEAYQFRTSAPLHQQPGVGRGREPGGAEFFYVTTAHGQQVTVQDGDWIVAEPDGRGFYPVKPDIFAARYDSVDEPPPARCEAGDEYCVDGVVYDPDGRHGWWLCCCPRGMQRRAEHTAAVRAARGGG